MKRDGKQTEGPEGRPTELHAAELDGVSGGGDHALRLKSKMENSKVASTSRDGGKTDGDDLLIGGTTSHDD